MMTDSSAKPEAGQSERNRRFHVLAHSDYADIAGRWTSVGGQLSWRHLRKPETGLVMLRGRMGGNGAAFNLGEASVTRCSVLLENATEGHAMILGQDHRKAELVALIDAMAQSGDEMCRKVDGEIIAPLAALQTAKAKQKSAETARTKVNFFTLVRGEDAA